MKLARWSHLILSGYMWLVLWLPVGDWNRQIGGPWIDLLERGGVLTTADLYLLTLVSLPTLLCFLAWRAGSVRILTVALLVDVIWLGFELQARWIPYVMGTPELAAKFTRASAGARTEWLPSFGTHDAPDAMHTVLGLLLLAALWTGLVALRQWWQPAAETARSWKASGL